MCNPNPMAWQTANDPQRKSWVGSANDPANDFPIQNLPFGVFSDSRNTSARVGVAIGDQIVDLAVLADNGLLTQSRDVFACSSLNRFIALGPIGYNGRASSVVVSDTPVKRPNGQIKLPESDRPVFGPCRKLDIELETGFIVGANTRLGEPIACDQAEAPTWNDQRPLTLPSSNSRTFLQDGDEVVLRGWCQGDGYRVGFGTCSGKILPAPEPA